MRTTDEVRRSSKGWRRSRNHGSKGKSRVEEKKKKDHTGITYNEES